MSDLSMSTGTDAKMPTDILKDKRTSLGQHLLLTLLSKSCASLEADATADPDPATTAAWPDNIHIFW